jgi:hypothetical protein
MAWTLCSKEDVVGITHAPESALEDFWSNTVEGLIRRHLGMPHLGEQVTVTDERHNGDGTYILLVRKPPIVSVSSLLLNGAALSASDYVVTDFSIQLLYTKFTKGILNVKVSYVSGSVDVDDIDPIISMTAAAMIAAIWNYRGRGGADASIKWGTAPAQEGEDTPNANVGLTSHLHTIMKRMLRRGRLRVK